jgi:hypothetical protein
LMLDFGGTIRAVFEYLGLEPPRALEDQTLSETANQPIDLWAWRSRRGITGSRRREGPTRRAATPTSKAWASTPQPVSLLTGP